MLGGQRLRAPLASRADPMVLALCSVWPWSEVVTRCLLCHHAWNAVSPGVQRSKPAPTRIIRVAAQLSSCCQRRTEATRSGECRAVRARTAAEPLLLQSHCQNASQLTEEVWGGGQGGSK